MAVALLTELSYVILTEADYYEESERTEAVDAALAVYEKVTEAVRVGGNHPMIGECRRPKL
ncbi:MAG: hypothetical protein ACXWE5_06230 [Actinomycetota bacterium]